MDFNARIESLFEEYDRQRNSLSELQEKMRGISATATSQRREVAVTVGQNGVLTDIQFPTSAYRRMTPKELASVITATYTDAKEQAMVQATEVLKPFLPDGMDAGSLVRGTAGAEAYFPAEPRMATSVREMLGLGRVSR
ncbi:YbaB/EbfC family nucleoid-associated protein [Micromonospora sp. NPDC051196]|uniref:YbaB/EbfC family nucleoid-associated protein n=1 Tax=Micromonospora sp. NPDC051196 TaxID=3155281 RepID=UPI0034494D00